MSFPLAPVLLLGAAAYVFFTDNSQQQQQQQHGQSNFGADRAPAYPQGYGAADGDEDVPLDGDEDEDADLLAADDASEEVKAPAPLPPPVEDDDDESMTSEELRAAKAAIGAMLEGMKAKPDKWPADVTGHLEAAVADAVAVDAETFKVLKQLIADNETLHTVAKAGGLGYVPGGVETARGYNDSGMEFLNHAFFLADVVQPRKTRRAIRDVQRWFRNKLLETTTAFVKTHNTRAPARQQQPPAARRPPKAKPRAKPQQKAEPEAGAGFIGRRVEVEEEEEDQWEEESEDDDDEEEEEEESGEEEEDEDEEE